MEAAPAWYQRKGAAAPSPQPSEGQQRLQLGICRWLRLLRLTLSEQIIQQSCQPDQPAAPALL